MGNEVTDGYNRIILIDTENVNSDCLEFLSDLNENDFVIFLKSDKSFRPGLEFIPIIRSWMFDLEVVEVKQQGTANAMDFCLVSELGYLIAILPESSFYIISNDHGYRPVVTLWRQRGYKLKLFGSTECVSYENNLTYNVLQGDEMIRVLAKVRQLVMKDSELKEKLYGTKSVQDTNQKIEDSKESEESTEYTGETQNSLEETNNEAECTEEFTNNSNSDVEEHTEVENVGYIETETCNVDKVDTTEEKLENTEEVEVETSENDTTVETLEDTKKEVESTQVNDINKEIKDNEALNNEKHDEKLSDVSLEELEESILSDKEYNALKLRKLVGKFSKDKESKLVKILLNHKEFNSDVSEEINEVIKKNFNKYILSIEQSWDVFRHE